jgi:hypothetical protein
MKDLISDLVEERYRPKATPPPDPLTPQDDEAARERRRRVLMEMPGDELPGEEEDR